jgi:16S rRNA (guanine527-N7)-methyltransferase
VNDVVSYLERRAGTALGRALSASEHDILHKYLKLLIKWQKSQRLVGSSEAAWIVDHVIADSLLFARVIPAGCRTLCDVGSGAGVPGIPLAAVMPTVKVTLLEARQKRGSFLAAAIRELGLANCRLLIRRLEDAGPETRGGFDVAVMRCAGDPTAMWPQVRGLLNEGGVAIATGPPQRRDVEFGEWLEVEGPFGRRRFWMHRAT